MSALIFINLHYVWQFDVHDFILSDIVYNNCHYPLARRLRQAFFMEVFL